MLLAALAGASLIVLGLIVDSVVVAALGAIMLGGAPAGLIVPALRFARARRLDPRPYTGYWDQNFEFGAMHLLGFSSEDFDPRRSASKGGAPAEPEGDDEGASEGVSAPDGNPR